jgi:hypothetical protein
MPIAARGALLLDPAPRPGWLAASANPASPSQLQRSNSAADQRTPHKRKPNIAMELQTFINFFFHRIGIENYIGH